MISRTRFLEDLDRMIMLDRQGAIDDMLKVLRELKVIESVYASLPLRDLPDDEGYRDAAKRQVAAMIGAFLLQEKEVAFTERTDEPYGADIHGTVEFVRRSGK